MATLHLFTRDLRLEDHPALLAGDGDRIGLFVFTADQVSAQNRLRSQRSIRFMIGCLSELEERLERRGGGLWVEYGDTVSILDQIADHQEIARLTVTEDWTPYALRRQRALEQWTEERGIEYQCHRDALLAEDRMTQGGDPYQVWSSWYKQVVEDPIPEPDRSRVTGWIPPPRPWNRGVADVVEMLEESGWLDPVEGEPVLRGGRREARRLLRGYDWEQYGQTDCLGVVSTQLSAHHHYGTLSIRESYHGGGDREWQEGLYWREWHYYLSRHWSGYYEYEHLFKEADGDSESLWADDYRARWRAWRQGKTGIPIVDAIQRQLLEEGWIGNRERLILGESVKLFRFPWRYGERHFTRQLIDIDRAQNMGNWNWVVSFGLDRSRFLRIFNPWEQGKRYDPQAEYIHRWLPELEDVPARQLHAWDQHHDGWETDYPAPIIDYATEREAYDRIWKSLYR